MVHRQITSTPVDNTNHPTRPSPQKMNNLLGGWVCRGSSVELLALLVREVPEVSGQVVGSLPLSGVGVFAVADAATIGDAEVVRWLIGMQQERAGREVRHDLPRARRRCEQEQLGGVAAVRQAQSVSSWIPKRQRHEPFQHCISKHVRKQWSTHLA